MGTVHEAVVAGGVACEWLRPAGALTDAALLYLHGGGGVLGLTNVHRNLVGHLTLASKLPALLPDYRLAPEAPFPAGLEDCLTSYTWLLSQGISPARIVMVGDSAGGHLLISALLSLRDTAAPLPAAGVCLSPNTDPACRGESMRTNAKRDAALSPRFARVMMRRYVSEHDQNDPRLAVLKADLRGLPPLLIQVGAHEVLLSDALRFADRATGAGVKTKLAIWPSMWHGWQTLVPHLKEANTAVDELVEFIQEHLEPI